jgi:DNA-binding MarR family transcriptional regulator
MKTGKLVLQIRSASREIVRQLGLLNNRFSSIGSTSQCHALVELDTHGIMTLIQLSVILNLEKSTTSRLIMQMSDEGICQIQSDENDRRNKLISLTEQGLILVNQIHVEAKAQVMQALDMMSEEEKNTVARGLSMYANALKQSRPQYEYKSRKPLKKNIRQDTP